jgi:rhodanese-related sulfurtransferase
VHVAWYEYPELAPNPSAFAQAVLREVRDVNAPLLLLCRSAKRTIPAGAALEAAGFTQVINILHGFEGDLDINGHRSSVNGWRFDGLPWVQT